MEERRKSPDLTVISSKLDKLVEAQERTNIALFAKDDDNEFESPGVMTVMQKLNTHIDVWCSIASGTKRFLKFAFWISTSIAGLMAAGKAAGWW